MPETPAEAACPPHRWFIEAQYGPDGGSETWTCTQCHETKTVNRGHGDVARPPWTVGKATSRRPESEPPAPPAPAQN
ncbi:MAG TPA: hypothetical protein VF157_15175 [Chloroflexota bacterium]